MLPAPVRPTRPGKVISNSSAAAAAGAPDAERDEKYLEMDLLGSTISSSSLASADDDDGLCLELLNAA